MAKDQTGPPELSCCEDNEWVPILHPGLDPAHPLVQKLAAMNPDPAVELHADPFTLSLAAADAVEYHRIGDEGKMSFHLTGCTGDPEHEQPQQDVAETMSAQMRGPDAPSFFYHLGDIAYKPKDDESTISQNQRDLYDREFYAAYNAYPRKIFAIAGNHDGKYKVDKGDGKLKLKQSSMWHFLMNFCALSAAPSPDNGDGQAHLTDPNRPAMTQPYPYWVLETPLAYIVGLYANVVNGGALDDPDSAASPQFRWLVNRLTAIRAENQRRIQQLTLPRKAVLVAVHYPPYSWSANFKQRGDPTVWQYGYGKHPNAEPLGNVLQRAFKESEQRPDAVFSAHAHFYQRMTYTYGDTGQQVPYLIAGSGGHFPLENGGTSCMPERTVIEDWHTRPFGEVKPPGLEIATGDGLALAVPIDDSHIFDFGFMRISLTPEKLVGDFFERGKDTPTDAFTLNLKSGKLES